MASRVYINYTTISGNSRERDDSVSSDGSGIGSMPQNIDMMGANMMGSGPMGFNPMMPMGGDPNMMMMGPMGPMGVSLVDFSQHLLHPTR